MSAVQEGRMPMIVVTRLNGSRFAVNPDLIERIHASPDTTLVLVDGSSYIVTETLDEIIELVARYRAKVIALAHAASSEPSDLQHRTGEIVSITRGGGKTR
jgi:flagellar protein FlbD